MREKPFMLCNTDNNVGWCCLDKSLYIKLAEEHLLGNSQVYKKLSFNLLNTVTLNIINKLSKFKDNGHISDRLFNAIVPNTKCSLGKFRWLEKLH